MLFGEQVRRPTAGCNISLGQVSALDNGVKRTASNLQNKAFGPIVPICFSRRQIMGLSNNSHKLFTKIPNKFLSRRCVIFFNECTKLSLQAEGASTHPTTGDISASLVCIINVMLIVSFSIKQFTRNCRSLLKTKCC